MKNLASIIIIISSTFLVSCSGGDPSISILPSQDLFTQTGTEIVGKTDILWVIDNSGSMAPYQSELQAKFSSFISVFASKGYDYRMAVISTDGWFSNLKNSSFNYNDQLGSAVNTALGATSCYANSTISSKFLEGNPNSGAPNSSYPLIASDDATIDFSLTSAPADSDPSDDIETIFNLNVGLGIEGCGAEGGLESIRTAFDNPFNTQFDFPRAGAHLAIIVVTDEEDFSSSTYMNPTDLSTQAYHDHFKNIANEKEGYTFHSIALFNIENAGTISATCKDENDVDVSVSQYATVGSRYEALSDLSGGIKSPLCHDFSISLQNIAQKIVEKAVEFPLSEVPADPNGLVVQVKNQGSSEFVDIPQDATNGWTYDATANSIIFHGTGVPEQGAQLNIFYDPNSL